MWQICSKAQLVAPLTIQMTDICAVVFFQFRYKYFPNRRGGVAGFGMAAASRRRPDDNGGGGRHAWGAGHQLGRD